MGSLYLGYKTQIMALILYFKYKVYLLAGSNAEEHDEFRGKDV